MSKAEKSGITVQKSDVPLILGMIERGDRKHDIAAWFGLNQGRIKEVEDGDHGTPPLTLTGLPPSGSPGPRAWDLRRALDKVTNLLKMKDYSEAEKHLAEAIMQFDADA